MRHVISGFACGTQLLRSHPPAKRASSTVSKRSYYGDGASPAAPLVNGNGTLYGTTPNGGRREGTERSLAITQSGTENVLAQLQHCSSPRR